MSSSLTPTTLIVNDTQPITGIKDILNNSNSEVPTCGAIIRYLTGIRIRKTAVGGTIFYINSDSTNTYTFYNASGTQVSEPTVGTDCTGWTCKIIGNDVDKYYVYNTSAMFKRDRTGTQSDPYVAWTYLDTTNQSYIDGTSYTSGLPSDKQEWEYYGYRGRVYETLDSKVTKADIGIGKANTQSMMSLRGGIYVQGSNLQYKGRSQYSETIWYICDQFNKGTYNLNGSSVPNNTGCNDWYIPSKDELSTMASNINDKLGASAFASMLYSGSTSTGRIFPWSSSAYSAINRSWHWWWSNNTDIGMVDNSRYEGDDKFCLALSRSF